LARKLRESLRQLQRAVETCARACPVAADRQFIIGPKARTALQPFDIGNQSRDIRERVAMEADERALGADIELGDTGSFRIRLDLHELDEIGSLGRERAEAVDHL